MSQRPFLAWPGWQHLSRAGGLAVAVGLCFSLVYGGADVLTGWRPLRFPVHFEWELAIPFVPATVLLYDSVYLHYILAPFVLRTRHELDAYALALVAVILVAGVCFLLYPSELAYPPNLDAGVWTGLVSATRRLALRYNLAPSLHVALAVLSMAVLATRARGVGKMLLWTWAGLIALSTLLLHQHHILDVVTGWPLGLMGKWCVYDRMLAVTIPRQTPVANLSTDPAPPA
jgi:membrane-associated phospholipid phosphatase